MSKNAEPMYFVHCDYSSDDGHEIKQFATIDYAMNYIHQYMHEKELDHNDAVRYFTIIKGEEIEMGVREVKKIVIAKEIFVREQKSEE